MFGTLESRLPEGGTNLFQEIKKKTEEAETAGKKIWKLSIGQPVGPAPKVAREAAAKAVMSDSEAMHEYQDNGSPGVPDFAKKFCQFHTRRDLNNSDLAFLPTPGIKPMLPLIPLACGSTKERPLKVGVMTQPGYPVPETWDEYLPYKAVPISLNPENEFRLDVNELDDDFWAIMLNYPHNPSGQTVGWNLLRPLCAWCKENNIRIFNDAAYTKLAFGEHSTLADVAVEFPNLSWVEAYSASKMGGNFTGWRIGAMVGTPDFIGDIATIKGNDDSGFFAPAAAGVLAVIEKEPWIVDEYCQMFMERQKWLCNTLQERGMQLAVKPQATFFNLWKTPKKAFGVSIESAKHFNYLMIEKTGIVGVHFEPYIRYAVVADILQPNFKNAIVDAFDMANVEY